MSELKILRKKRILIISPESWQHDFVSKHHYSIELAKAENQVFFLNPPSKKNLCLSSVFPGLSIIDYKPVIRGLNVLPGFLSDYFCKIEIRKIEQLAGGCFDIVWSFDPYRFQNLGLFNSKATIYFAADVHRNRRLETILADRSDVVIAPSELVLQGIRTYTPKKKVSHAVAAYFFQLSNPCSLPGSGMVKVGYVGNLNARYLNLKLLREAIVENPHCDFLLIGKREQSMSEWSSLPNVIFLGRKPNHELPPLLQACDILLLCYDTEQYWEQASNSHKIMEYLSSGKVVVSTRIAEYTDKGALLIMPKKNEELPSLLKKVSYQLDFYNNASNRLERTIFARQHTYEKELEKIDEIIQMYNHF